LAAASFAPDSLCAADLASEMTFCASARASASAFSAAACRSSSSFELSCRGAGLRDAAPRTRPSAHSVPTLSLTLCYAQVLPAVGCGSR